MRFVLSILLLASTLAAPLASARAVEGQLEATVSAIDGAAETMSLDDGNIYRLPGEFDLASLEPGTRVYVYFRETDGVREIFDLEVLD